jgi:Rad3-related DNA helicase
VNFDNSLEQPKINIGKAIIPIGIAYGTMLLLMQAMPKMEMSKTSYSESSYNQSESKDLEKLLIDSLGQYLTPDIKIYDTVKNSNFKYISAILKLKENYIEDDDTYRQLENKTENLIYSKFPKETFTGQINYVFQASGQFQSRAGQIGTNIRRRDDK